MGCSLPSDGGEALKSTSGVSPSSSQAEWKGHWAKGQCLHPADWLGDLGHPLSDLSPYIYTEDWVADPHRAV